MGLIDLKTDLKSLRYGNDRVYGGNSGQPYITNNIPDDISPYIGTTDFLLRGGINIVRDSATDVLRLGKMFADVKSPNGLLFIAKQQLLSRTSVRTQTSGILNEGSYSPLNTLAEAGLVSTGGHLVKQGLNPFADTGAYSNNGNLYDVRVTPTATNPKKDTNRLINLLEANIEQQPRSKNNVTLNNGINVMTYTGGPGSILGVGNTGIRYSKTSKTFLSQPSKNSSFDNNTWVYNSTLTNAPFSPPVILPPLVQTSPQPNSVSTSNGSKSSPKIQDFRKILRTQIGDLKQDGRTSTNSGATPISPEYNTQKYELKTSLGQPGQRSGKSYANYDKGVIDLSTNKSTYGDVTINSLGSAPSGLDRINSVPIYRDVEASTDSKLDDLCSFRIAIIDNDSPAFKTFLHFRAFLGGISDAYQADWTPFKYLGRGENFYTYNGFTRQMSLSWTVAAQSKEELIPMYKKLNYLASTLAPDYSPQGYMRGNLAQLTIGGYVYEQPGFITGLTYDIQDDSPWEIGINTAGEVDETVRQLPHIIRVSSFNFTPIQKYLPKKQNFTFYTNPNDDVFSNNQTGFAQGYGNQPFISLENKDGNLYGTDPFQKTIKIPTTIDGQTNFDGNVPIGTNPELTIPGFISSFS
jgi:hypothetical protein